jgi:hypothetical protein
VDQWLPTVEGAAFKVAPFPSSPLSAKRSTVANHSARESQLGPRTMQLHLLLPQQHTRERRCDLESYFTHLLPVHMLHFHFSTIPNSPGLSTTEDAANRHHHPAVATAVPSSLDYLDDIRSSVSRPCHSSPIPIPPTPPNDHAYITSRASHCAFSTPPKIIIHQPEHPAR